MDNNTYVPIMIDVLISDIKSIDLNEKISENLRIKYSIFQTLRKNQLTLKG